MRHEWITKTSYRLGTFVRDQLEGKVSAREIKRWIEGNLCEVNGMIERFASRELVKGDRVVLREKKMSVKAKEGRVEPLFQDKDLLAYSKPAGVPSESLIKNLKAFGKLELIHRLDKDTSGVILLARTHAAKVAFEALFRQREIKKVYWAIVVGSPKGAAGVCQSYLGPIHQYEGQTIYGSVSDAQGRYAETAWRCVQRKGKASLIECLPKTGRTHQLRVHLKELGCAILGDYQYDRQQSIGYRPERQMLHALTIAFKHPISGINIQVSAPLPDDFQDALAYLGLTAYTSHIQDGA